MAAYPHEETPLTEHEKPDLCPACAAPVKKFETVGFWDGRGENGELIGGNFLEATCSQCSANLRTSRRGRQKPTQLLWRLHPSRL